MSCHQHRPPSPTCTANRTTNKLVTLKASPVSSTTKERKTPPKAHSSLGVAAVGPAELSRVRRKDFDGYLRAAGDGWEKLRGPTTITTGDSDQPTPLPGNLPLPPETSSSVFFDASFDLSDLKTFASVSTFDDPTLLSHPLSSQEKLSHHLDTLVRKILGELLGASRRNPKRLWRTPRDELTRLYAVLFITRTVPARRRSIGLASSLRKAKHRLHLQLNGHRRANRPQYDVPILSQP
ncbi:hypothetical protein PQX77_011837 [Marasmius sp. AFHP31]|nr:hypothetical protein PQX77_011837 [Marasmius sp. AFHP31]